MSREPLMHSPPDPAMLVSAAADINPLDAIRKLRSVAPALSEQLSLYGQLFKVEWAEEKLRLSGMLAIGLLGFTLFLCANIACGVLLATLGWQAGYLLPAVTMLLVIYAVACWFAWRKWKVMAALSVNSFITFRAELTADIAMIRSKL